MGVMLLKAKHNEDFVVWYLLNKISKVSRNNFKIEYLEWPSHMDGKWTMKQMITI